MYPPLADLFPSLAKPLFSLMLNDYGGVAYHGPHSIEIGTSIPVRSVFSLFSQATVSALWNTRLALQKRARFCFFGFLVTSLVLSNHRFWLPPHSRAPQIFSFPSEFITATVLDFLFSTPARVENFPQLKRPTRLGSGLNSFSILSAKNLKNFFMVASPALAPRCGPDRRCRTSPEGMDARAGTAGADREGVAVSWSRTSSAMARIT